MASIDYRQTQLWARAKSLLTESYRTTATWASEGNDLAKDIRLVVRQIVRSVPGAFEKGGITGNLRLNTSAGQFADLEALCEVAEVLGYAEFSTLQPLLDLADLIKAEFQELRAAAKERAREMRMKRTMLTDPFNMDEDDD